MARGGARKGTPGRAYQNRTDLNVARAPQAGLATAAAGGQTAPPPASPPGVSLTPPGPVIGPDQVPTPTDPSARPDEPITAGLPTGPGDGPEVLVGTQGLPSDVGPIGDTIRALMLVSPDNAALNRLHDRLVAAKTGGEL